MEQRIVNVPLVGGINEEDDTFSVAPPEMKTLVNVSAVKKGALDRRLGWELVPKTEPGVGVDIQPARAFVGTTQSDVSPSIEAISSCDTASGKRAVLAAGNKFYEYVGSDANHGFRQVNDLPRYCGTLSTAASTGGAVIEIESALFADETKRITVWTTGLRTGTELASDETAKEQAPGDGNSLYYSIQWVDSEAFIVPPTRLTDEAGLVVTSAQDMRLVLLQNDPGTSGSETWPFVAWCRTSTSPDVLLGALINPNTGVQSTAVVLPSTITNITTCHRRFDIVATSRPGQFYQYSNMGLVYAVGEQDTGSNTTPAKLEIRVAVIDQNTGAITNKSTIANAMPTAPPGAAWVPWAQRGVELEQNPRFQLTHVPSGWKIEIGIACRVIARQKGGEGYLNVIDGQFAVSLLTITGFDPVPVPPTPALWSASIGGWQYIPSIGYQTKDTLANVIATSTDPLHFSGNPNMQGKYFINLSGTASLGFAPGPYDSNGQPIRSSEIAMTVKLSDPTATRQTYFCSIGTGQTLADAYKFYLMPQSVFPYRDARNGGTDTLTSSQSAFGLVSWAYPRNVHQYRNDSPIAIQSLPPNPDRQTNVITIPASGATNTGWTPGTYPGVKIVETAAGVEICTATVHIATDGSVDAIAIEDCATGPGPGYAYAGPNTSVVVTLAPGGPYDPGGGVLTAAGFNLAANDFGSTINGTDVPDHETDVFMSSNQWYRGGVEHCVHRWTVGRRSSDTLMTFAASSVSAIKETNPQGDPPFGAASPLRYNNFFEAYLYGTVASGSYSPLVSPTGGTSSSLICALGGPWRIVGGLVEDSSELYLSVCPGGDDAQASTFLLRLPPAGSTGTITVPAGNLDEPPFPTPSAVTYDFDTGVFIESANMMRTTAPPMNVPAIRYTGKGLTVGALRHASSKGQQSCMAIDYEALAQNWRSMQRFAEYTFINGGILSVFDGVNCNEHGSLIWPQRDLTSISFGDGLAQTAFVSVNASAFGWACADVNLPLAGSFKIKFAPLRQITRPYFFNESGMKWSSSAPVVGVGYATIQTQWGGDPSRNYESIYQELRTQQFSSFTKSGLAGGTSAYGPHYYGRYQAAATDFDSNSFFGAGVPSAMVTTDNTGNNLAYFVYAPRSAKGFSWNKPNGGVQNRYSQDESGGNFLMSFCYEYMDGTGRTSRSAPSAPAQWTICTEVSTKGLKPEDDRQGGSFTVFKWGFFVPRLELTNRTKSASEDPRRVTLQPYSTVEPYSTVMYRMPWGNFLNPISDFVVDRNVTRGVVAHASIPFDGTNAYTTPCGYVITNTNSPPYGRGCFDGPTGDFNGMLREPYLYTTGGVLDNVAPPSCKAMCVHQNRLVIGGADDATVVWYSKQLSPTDAPGFNDLQTIRIEAGGAVTGIASMNSALFIFKESDIYVVSGSMPDDTGNGNTLAEPVRLPSGIGCIDPRSVISTPIGIFFQSKRSIELLTPDLRITPIGDKIIDQRASFPYVTSVAHNATTQEVYFILHDTSVTRDSEVVPLTRTFVFSYMINAWYEWKNSLFELGRGMAAITVIGDKAWTAMRNPFFSSPKAYVYRQWNGYVDKVANSLNTYAYSYYLREFLTAPFSLNQVQGFQRVKRIRLLGTPIGTSFKAAYELSVFTDDVAPQTCSWTSGEVDAVVAVQGYLQLEAHVAQQKGQLISLGVQESQPATFGQDVVNFRLANIALVVGLKTGLNKRITEDAKH